MSEVKKKERKSRKKRKEDQKQKIQKQTDNQPQSQPETTEITVVDKQEVVSAETKLEEFKEKKVESKKKGRASNLQTLSEKQVLEKLVDEELAQRNRIRTQFFKGGDVPPPTGGVVVAQNLSPQLGSSPKVLSRGEYDMRLLSNIDKTKLMALIYLTIRGKKVKAYAQFVDEYLHFVVGIKGRGRKDLINMQRASTGASPPEAPEEPGWIGKHITNRNWKEEKEE